MSDSQAHRDQWPLDENKLVIKNPIDSNHSKFLFIAKLYTDLQTLTIIIQELS